MPQVTPKSLREKFFDESQHIFLGAGVSSLRNFLPDAIPYADAS
jgi:hypothetical protein